MKPSDFVNNPNKLIPEEFFVGTTKGVGVFYDRFGDIRTSFVIDLNGTWDGKKLLLVEDLTYENGEKLKRTYNIIKIDQNTYHAYTEDIKGFANIEVFGNTMKWTYDLNQEIKGSKMLLRFHDWMHLQPDGTILNRAKAYKWGFEVGEVFMSISKKS